MSWSDQTLWVKCEEGFRAIVADNNGPPVEGILGDEGVQAVRAKDFAPCNECPYIESCMESLWNEGLRMGGPQDNEGAIAISSTVHTCACCDEKVLTVFSEEYVGTGAGNFWKIKPFKRIVPDGCPRWKSETGSAWVCDGCRERRREIEKAHPRYQKRQDSMKEAVEHFQGAVSATDEFTKKRHVNAVATLAVENMQCDFSLYEDENVLFAAQEVWMEMLKTIKTTVPDFWGDEDMQNAPFKAHFLEAGLDFVYHSLVRHEGDALKVIEELVLFLTDTGAFARHWACFRVSEKKFIKRGWQGVIRRVMSSHEGQV